MNLRILSLLHGGLLCGGLAISACAAAGHADGQGADAAAPRDRHRENAPALQTPQQKVQEDPARREDSNGRPGKAASDSPDGAAGTDSRDSKGQPNSTTGSPGHGGLQGAGASAGSGGTPDLRD